MVNLGTERQAPTTGVIPEFSSRPCVAKISGTLTSRMFAQVEPLASWPTSTGQDPGYSCRAKARQEFRDDGGGWLAQEMRAP